MAPIMSPLIVFVIALCLATSTISTDDVVGDEQQPFVKIATATFYGKRMEAQPEILPGFSRGVAMYTGIPYAEAPVGELRYSRPVAKVIEGDFDATKPPIACAQVESPFFVMDMPQAEDCLHLNVFVPEPQAESVPVMLWIHGGAYHMGAGVIGDDLEPMLALPAIGDVIVVTINYRLGMLGFLTTGDDEIPANLGLLDQRLAMLWVKENIAAFGGDPHKITIFGESAGSGSVNMHLLSTMSAGLFSGAIMQSGALTVWTHLPQEYGIQMTNDFGKAAGCETTTSSELVKCLREKPVAELKTVQENVTTDVAQFMLSPVRDGEFLLKDPYELAAEGSFNPAHVMIGSLSEEGNMILMPALFGQEGPGMAVIDEATYRGFLAPIAQITDPVIQDAAAVVFGSDKMFSSSELDYAEALSGVGGALLFVCPTFKVTDQMAKSGRNVYAYLMTHRPSHSIWGKNTTGMGATHGEDLPYVFGSGKVGEIEDEDYDYYLRGHFTEEEAVMSVQMIKYWSNFAKTGDPNLSSDDTNQDQAPDSTYPAWSKFTSMEPAYKELALSFPNHAGKPLAKECHFLSEVAPKLKENAEELARLKLLLEEKVSADSGKSCNDPETCP